MTGIDTSALIPLGIEEHPQHAAATALVHHELQSGQTQIAVLPLVLSEFLHAVSDPKRFKHPKTVPEGIEWLEEFLRVPGVVLFMPEARAIPVWLRWMREHRLGRKRTLDAQLAATLHTAGVRRLLTANPDDFRVFDVFELLVPGAAEESDAVE
jgi:predicted nucleic acid-binding protein